jgi:2-polyprenyl-3-methyl-5-hydroxy-6-metoxy-1,4-benzoquinol methylase
MITKGGALRGGMPRYKYVGNQVLTTAQNFLLSTSLSEFHSGYRVYSVRALQAIPFALNTNEFHFDTEIIIQLHFARARIVEEPIPTHYGDEDCHVNGVEYAINVIRAVMRAWLSERDLFYDRRFDCKPSNPSGTYRSKLDFTSSHTAAFEHVAAGTTVLDLGCGNPNLSRAFVTKKRCKVTGIDVHLGSNHAELEGFYLHDLNVWPLPVSPDEFDYVLMLDVLEHLVSPEAFVDHLREVLSSAPATKFIVSVPNVAFVVQRTMLLLGQFNYGKRGILDLTHTRLFTKTSICRLLQQSGFVVDEVVGVPAPFPFAVGDGRISRLLLWLNGVLIRFSVGLFSYQILLQARARPAPRHLLDVASEASARSVASARTEG